MDSKVCSILIISLLFVCSSFSAEKLLEWKCDGNATDSSGNGLDGVIYNYAAYDTGVDGQAFVSDGSNCIYKVGLDPNSLHMKADHEWSVNIWVYTDTTPASWNVAWVLGPKPYATSGASRALYCSGEGNIVFTDGSGTNYLSTGVPFSVGEWQMLTTTYDGQKVRVYKNAALIGSMDFTFIDGEGEVRMPSNPGWGTYLAGKFDEFTVWDSALSQNEIVDLIIPGVLPDFGLATQVVHYTMEDPNSLGVLPDHSENANDGVYTGYTGSVEDWIADGVVGGCLIFDGGQKVDVPATVSQNSQYSVTFWFKAGWQPYTTALYSEKGDGGSLFAIRGNGNQEVYIFSKDYWYNTIFSMTVDFSAYLNSTWNHLALVADGQKATLYMNGQYVNEASYARTDYKQGLSGYIGYLSGGSYLGSWSDVSYVDEFQLWDGVLTQHEIQAMLADGNFDLDTDVDGDDLSVIASEWLVDNMVSAGTTSVVDNFEAASINDWVVHVSQTYSGTGTISLTSNAYEGTQALSWAYDLPATTATSGNYTSIVYDLAQATDLSTYDVFQIQAYRHSGNSEEDLMFIKFIDGSDNVIAESWISGSSSTTSPVDEWSLWDVDLNDLLGPQGSGDVDASSLTAIRYILIGCGSEDTSARTGTIDFDDAKFIEYPACNIEPTADLNMDCKVNMDDLGIFASNWLLGVY